jgi:hypothetical protein
MVKSKNQLELTSNFNEKATHKITNNKKNIY